MRFLTLFSAVGLASQALSSPFSCDKDISEMTLAETDEAVKTYFSKLEPPTKKTLLHDTTGPEAGADVRCLSHPAWSSPQKPFRGADLHLVRRLVLLRPSSRIRITPNSRSTGCAMPASSTTRGSTSSPSSGTRAYAPSWTMLSMPSPERNR